MDEGQQIINREPEITVHGTEERNTAHASRMEGKKQLDVGQKRWRDEGDGSLADDEEEEEENEDTHGEGAVFTPLVETVTRTAEKQAGADDVGADDVRADDVRADDVSMRWENTRLSPRDHHRSCHVCCGEKTSSVLFFLAGGVMFPLLVWAGYDLLPVDLPPVRSAPSRLVYTLRCALFATFPIILGVFVHGASRVKFRSLNPLFEGNRTNRHTVVHMTYVRDSLRLFLLFFLQLGVTATYLHLDALKLVPLLTIVFVFGRLIYWPSVCFGSSVRVLGFSLSFLPVLALTGLNLYFICFATGEGAVFDVAPPTTPPPPKARWWG